MYEGGGVNQDSRMELNETISRNLKAWLVIKGISGHTLSSRVGMSSSLVYSIVSGKTNTSIENVWKICQALGISISDVVYDKRKRKAS